LTFSCYLISDRIMCVLMTFYQRGHFVMLTIRNLYLISVQSWTYVRLVKEAFNPLTPRILVVLKLDRGQIIISFSLVENALVT